MKKIGTINRYEAEYGSTQVSADVSFNDKGEIQAITGNVSNPDLDLQAWFHINDKGDLNAGGVPAEDKVKCDAVVEAAREFYKEAKAL